MYSYNLFRAAISYRIRDDGIETEIETGTGMIWTEIEMTARIAAKAAKMARERVKVKAKEVAKTMGKTQRTLGHLSFFNLRY